MNGQNAHSQNGNGKASPTAAFQNRNVTVKFNVGGDEHVLKGKFLPETDVLRGPYSRSPSTHAHNPHSGRTGREFAEKMPLTEEEVEEIVEQTREEKTREIGREQAEKRAVASATNTILQREFSQTAAEQESRTGEKLARQIVFSSLSDPGMPVGEAIKQKIQNGLFDAVDFNKVATFLYVNGIKEGTTIAEAREMLGKREFDWNNAFKWVGEGAGIFLKEIYGMFKPIIKAIRNFGVPDDLRDDECGQFELQDRSLKTAEMPTPEDSFAKDNHSESHPTLKRFDELSKRILEEYTEKVINGFKKQYGDQWKMFEKYIEENGLEELQTEFTAVVELASQSNRDILKKYLELGKLTQEEDEKLDEIFQWLESYEE